MTKRKIPRWVKDRYRLEAKARFGKYPHEDDGILLRETLNFFWNWATPRLDDKIEWHSKLVNILIKAKLDSIEDQLKKN